MVMMIMMIWTLYIEPYAVTIIFRKGAVHHKLEYDDAKKKFSDFSRKYPVYVRVIYQRVASFGRLCQTRWSHCEQVQRTLW